MEAKAPKCLRKWRIRISAAFAPSATAPVGERGNFAPALPERYAHALHAWGRAGFPTSMGTSPVPVLSHQARHHRCIKAAVRCNLPSSVIRMS